MKNIQNIIKQIFEYHQSSQEFFDEFDECHINLSKCEEKIIECLSLTPEKRWSDSMLEKAMKIIHKHKESLILMDFDLDNINFDTTINNQKDLVRIIDGKLIINKKYNNIFSNYTTIKDNICLDINYENIYEIINLFSKNLINVEQKAKCEINHFLNNINYGQKTSIPKKIINDNYNVELLDFQESGTLYGLLNKEIIIADEMGLGKTIQSLSIISFNRSFPAFIICPKSLKYKWEKEASKIKNASIKVYEKGDDLTNLDKDIYIFTYNDLPKIIDQIERHKNVKSIIFDESQSLKNSKTQRSKNCKRLTKNKVFIIELTGSPILNRTSELLNQIDIINKTNLFGSNIEFINKYCQREKIYKREDIENFCEESESIRLRELSNIMKQNFYIRRRKSDTLFSLPEKRRDFIYVDINNKKEYEKLTEQYKKETDQKTKKQLLSKLKEVAAKGKINAIKEQIDDFLENDEKVIVFAYHRKMQKALIDLYPEALTITSEKTEKERFESQEEFLNNPQKKLIICSIRAGYYGLDLYSSSQIIFAEMDWTPEINKQCEDRAHRIGLINPVNIWYIVAKNTIEEKIIKINKEKIDIIQKVNQEYDDFFIQTSKEHIKDILIQMI